MNNNFTIDDIKNSVEYQWRKQQIKMLFCVWLITVGITLLTTAIPYLHNVEYLAVGLIAWLCVMAFMGVLLGVFMLYHHSKNRRLLKHFGDFSAHEVTLDRVATANMWRNRGAVYYIVSVTQKGITKNVDTSPCFSSSIFSKFTCDDYNNKKVVGLYDENLNKFYIIKKVG